MKKSTPGRCPLSHFPLAAPQPKTKPGSTGIRNYTPRRPGDVEEAAASSTTTTLSRAHSWSRGNGKKFRSLIFCGGTQPFSPAFFSARPKKPRLLCIAIVFCGFYVRRLVRGIRGEQKTRRVCIVGYALPARGCFWGRGARLL